jgi:hypothetical protein
VIRCWPLHQPWADLVIGGVKKVETRGRPCSTIVGQRVAIHANQTREHLWLLATSPFAELMPAEDSWFGAIIGTVFVKHAEQMTESYVEKMRENDPVEFAFGDYKSGRWAFELEDPQRFAKAVPWRATQGIFFVPEEALGIDPTPPAQGVLL